MATKSTAKSEFCRSFEWKKATKIKWLDSTGMVELSSERLAKIDLSGASGNFTQFQVSIINKTSGVIDSKTFKFADYLDTNKRKDSRSDWAPQNGFFVSSSIGMCWYIAEPMTTKPICVAIEQYIGMYR